jgi:GNAT superfamily N-acetyltransferase
MIRVAGPDDLDAVAALLCAFRDWWGSSIPSDETFRSTAAVLLTDPNTEYLLAGSSGLAQLRYRLSVWTGVEDCWLEDLYVRDDARGTGLGRALVEACFERARARGCRRIELDVNESNTGTIARYTRCGFSVEPKPPHPVPRQETGIDVGRGSSQTYMDLSLVILIGLGLIVCGWALSRPSADPGSGDYSGWDFEGDG